VDRCDIDSGKLRRLSRVVLSLSQSCKQRTVINTAPLLSSWDSISSK
jgi:hypothetical protein